MILKEYKKLSEIKEESEKYFPDMVKGVVDIKSGVISLNAEMHIDLEEEMLNSGSEQCNLIGFNIYFDDGEIELDSNINPPINRQLGFPRAGRLITEPKTVLFVENIIKKWVNLYE